MNKAAVKEHALRCSETCKGGRFTRVGSDFFAELEADFEAIIRKLDCQCVVNWPIQVELPEGKQLLDLSDRTKLHDVFTRLLTRLIQAKVERQPSCGCTLGRTK